MKFCLFHFASYCFVAFCYIWVYSIAACCSGLCDNGSCPNSSFIMELCVSNSITVTSVVVSLAMSHRNCEPRGNSTYYNTEDPLSTDECTKKNATSSTVVNSIVTCLPRNAEAEKHTMEKGTPSDNKVVESDVFNPTWHLEDTSAPLESDSFLQFHLC